MRPQTQFPGKFFKFPDGTCGILPKMRGKSNTFALWSANRRNLRGGSWMSRKYKYNCDVKHSIYIKDTVFGWYGGVCVCCGEDHMSILTLDHILDDGALQRRNSGVSGNSLYRKIYKTGEFKKPKDLQILCPNCQMGKQNGHGFCFHHPKKDLRIL